MELKRRVDLGVLFKRIVFAIIAVYLIIGFMPAEATTYSIDTELNIKSIGLTTPVTKLALENSELNTPDDIVGSFSKYENTTLLIGHSTTVFKNLPKIKKGDLISYGENTYQVKSIKIKAKQNISMLDLLKSNQKETLILMTCAGRKTENGFTHRLIVAAEKL